MPGEDPFRLGGSRENALRPSGTVIDRSRCSASACPRVADRSSGLRRTAAAHSHQHRSAGVPVSSTQDVTSVVASRADSANLATAVSCFECAL